MLLNQDEKFTEGTLDDQTLDQIVGGRDGGLLREDPELFANGDLSKGLFNERNRTYAYRVLNNQEHNKNDIV